MLSIRHSFLTALGALFFLAGPTSGQTLRYSNSDEAHTYTRTQEDHVKQTVNGQEQQIDIQSFWRFQAKVVEGASESLTVEVVHDSLDISSPLLTGERDFTPLYGQVVTISMDDRGSVREVTLPDSLPAIQGIDLETVYRTFFPRLPAADVGDGSTWSDTMSMVTNQNGLDIDIVRVNDYTNKGAIEYAGRQALQIDFTSSMELEGSGAQMGNEISISGTGTGSGSIYFSPSEGLFLGTDEQADITMDAFVVAQGQNLLIPIVQSRSESITLVE